MSVFKEGCVWDGSNVLSSLSNGLIALKQGI